MNTNFNTQITVNPENLPDEQLDEFDKLREELGPTNPIGEIQDIDDDGIEIDIIGRILIIGEILENSKGMTVKCRNCSFNYICR